MAFVRSFAPLLRPPAPIARLRSVAPARRPVFTGAPAPRTRNALPTAGAASTPEPMPPVFSPPTAVPASPQRRLGFARRRSDSWPEADILSLPPDVRPRPGETLDLILREKIYLTQARRGYRCNVDSHTLAHFAAHRLDAVVNRCDKLVRRPRVLDLGAGAGLVGILFARARVCSALALLELQSPLVDRARRNIVLNGLHAVSRVVQADVAGGALPAEAGLEGTCDVVLLNPPFYETARRATSQSRERLLAHYESTASLTHFLLAARAALDASNPSAFVALVHDVLEAPRVREAIASSGLYVASVQEMRHTALDQPTRVFFCLKLPGHLDEKVAHTEVMAPLVLHPQANGPCAYTEEIEQFLEDVPTPQLRIGRLRERDDGTYEGC